MDLDEERIAMCRLAIEYLRILACIALAAFCTRTAQADVFADGDHVMLQFGPYVYHRNHDPDLNSEPWLVGVEWESASRWEIGASYFRNSFFQEPCFYVYAGKRWFLGSGDEGPYFKLTGGPLYGYKEPHEDKVPLNNNGLGLAVVPALGYQYGRANVQLAFLKTVAVMLSFGYDFGK